MSDFDVVTTEVEDARERRDRLPAMSGLFRIDKLQWRKTKETSSVPNAVMVVADFVCLKPETGDKDLKVESPKGMGKSDYFVLGSIDDPSCQSKETITKSRGAGRLKTICVLLGYTGAWGIKEEDGCKVPRGLMTALQGKEIGIQIIHERSRDPEYAHRYEDNIKKYLDPKTLRPTISEIQMEDLPVDIGEPVGAAQESAQPVAASSD